MCLLNKKKLINGMHHIENSLLMSIFFLQAHVKFPLDYPYSPPTFRFLTKMWHPNIYEVRLFVLVPICQLFPEKKNHTKFITHFIVISSQCVLSTERRCLHLYPASPSGRPSEWRAALREVEPHTEHQVCSTK